MSAFERIKDMEKKRSAKAGVVPAGYEILDASGNHATWCQEIPQCHEVIAGFLGVPVAEIDRFKTHSRAEACGRKSFAAFERNDRVYEIVVPSKTIQRRCGRPRKH